MAIACMPLRDEVLDGRVIEVMATGITVQSGPIKAFISLGVSVFDFEAFLSPVLAQRQHSLSIFCLLTVI